jgi:hypothetical protein
MGAGGNGEHLGDSRGPGISQAQVEASTPS